jgi:hypothetical protein
VVWRPERSSSTTLVFSLWCLPTHWYTILCVTPPLTTKFEWQHVAQWCCNPEVGLCCDYTMFTEPNGYPTTCLDVAQYVVCAKSARAQSGKLTGFYTQIGHTSSIPFVHPECINIKLYTKQPATSRCQHPRMETGLAKTHHVNVNIFVMFGKAKWILTRSFFRAYRPLVCCWFTQIT